MTGAVPPWIRTLGQWVLCGGAGAGSCLIAALSLSGTGHPPTLWASAVNGLEWGLVGAAELGLLLWLYGLVTRGMRRGETTLVAVSTAALPFVANHWLRFAVAEALRPRLRWLTLVFIRPLPATSQYWSEFAATTLGALAGAVLAAALWGWPRRSRSIAVRNAGLSALLVVGSVVLVWWGLFRPQMSRACAASCLSNQKSLGLAFLMYARDHCDRLPPGRTSLELLGIDRARYDQALADPLADPLLQALGGGPMDGYSKNLQIWFCPADRTRYDWRGRLRRPVDPGPGVSYEWNASLAGRKVSSIGRPEEEWFLRDREPWHSGHRFWVDTTSRAVRR